MNVACSATTKLLEERGSQQAGLIHDLAVLSNPLERFGRAGRKRVLGLLVSEEFSFAARVAVPARLPTIHTSGRERQ
jgi:hypothetical protein